METKPSLLSLYQAIVDDCKIIIEKNVKQESIDQMNEKVKQDFKEFIQLFRDMLHASLRKGSVQSFAEGYLDTVLSNIEKQKYEVLNEKELYLAYGYLFSFNYLNELWEMGEIAKFNYESFNNFSKIIKSFGDEEKLKENYENYAGTILEGKIDNKSVKIFLQHLEKGKITKKRQPNVIENHDKRKRKKKNKQIQKEEEKKVENTIKNNTDNNSNQNESKINNMPNLSNQNQILISNNETIAETNSNNIENMNIPVNKERNQGINITNEEKKTNNISEKIIIDSDNIKQETKLNNDNDVNKDIDKNTNEIKEEINDINISIKQDNENINKNKEINKENREMKSEANINIKNNDDIKEETQIIKEETKGEENAEKNYEEEFLKKGNISHEQLIKIILENKAELNKIKENFNKKNEELDKKLNQTNEKLNNTKENLNKKNEELDKKLNQTNEELNNTKEELSKLKTEIANTKKLLLGKIENLEKSQKLMYYQISMYHSRDISKNIYFYFAKHLKIKNHDKPFFDLLEIMENLKKNGNTKDYSDEDKKNLRKFFKSLFFLNKVKNRMMHNNLTTQLQNEIKENKTNEDNDLLALLPPNSFDQLFKYLSFYIENNTKDQQLQKMMKLVYENEYINDEKLKGVKDTDEEVIKKEKDGSIKIQMSMEEINKVKSIFLNIKDFANN